MMPVASFGGEVELITSLLSHEHGGYEDARGDYASAITEALFAAFWKMLAAALLYGFSRRQITSSCIRWHRAQPYYIQYDRRIVMQ